MQVTTRFAAIALWAFCLTALPSLADDRPWAHLEGYRCEVLRGGATPPGIPGSTVLVCQIMDDGTPTGTSRQHSSDPSTLSPTLDSLLQLLTILDNARHDASLPKHDAVVPRPTP